jgi:hypothetical protein
MHGKNAPDEKYIFSDVYEKYRMENERRNLGSGFFKLGKIPRLLTSVNRTFMRLCLGASQLQRECVCL